MDQRDWSTNLMATTTPNYGWPVPTSSDLVKNGATAIEALGDAADATMATMVAKSIVDAKGDIIAATAADTVSRLAVGTNNQVLTADSSTATGLKWATPASSGGMTLLATTTLTGGSVTVSSLSTYKELWFVFRNAYVASNTYLELRFNSDTGSNYSVQWLKGVNTSNSTDGQVAATTGRVGFIGDSATATNRLAGIIRVAATDQTSGVSYVASGSFNDGTGSNTFVMNGRYNNSAVISSMQLFAGASTFSGGTLMTYGVN